MGISIEFLESGESFCQNHDPLWARFGSPSSPWRKSRCHLSVGLRAVGVTAINSVSIPTLLSCLALLCLQNAPSDLSAQTVLPAALHLPPPAPPCSSWSCSGPSDAFPHPPRECYIAVPSPPVIPCPASEGRGWSSSAVTALRLSLRAGSFSSCLQGFLIERAGRKTLLWKNYTVMALALGLLTVTLSLQVRPH